MTPAEAQVLLSMAAAYDNRRPDADAAKAWALALDGLPYIDCRDAIVAHYRGSTEWIMPAVVRAAVRRIRAKRIDDHPPLVPPPGLDDVQERRWLSEARRRVGDGEQIDSDAAYGELLTGAAVNFRELLPTPTTHPTPHAGATEKENDQ